jgi:uncharacterized metal-binding protein
VVTGLTFTLTWSGNLTLLVSGGFLFSGLMFGPDLDLYSRPFQRWGCLRWIWIPYQKAMRHRSILSHGLVIGTTLRVLYLTSWSVCLGIVLLMVIQLFGEVPWSWQRFAIDVTPLLFHYRVEGIALFVGLELGAVSHSLSDWTDSSYKRLKKVGLKGLMLQKVQGKKHKRRPNTKRKRQSTRRKHPASQRIK